jgi:diguanylate cyclase (GGDEF)-like protein
VASHDPLTGLLNRAEFHNCFGHALSGAKRRQSKLALLFLDLDRFKLINDTLGTGSAICCCKWSANA